MQTNGKLIILESVHTPLLFRETDVAKQPLKITLTSMQKRKLKKAIAQRLASAEEQ